MNIEPQLEIDKWTEIGINFSTLISIKGNFSQPICNSDIFLISLRSKRAIQK